MFTDEANHIYISMPMYNLIKYSGNYSDTSGSLWQLKIDEVPDSNSYLSMEIHNHLDINNFCTKNR